MSSARKPERHIEPGRWLTLWDAHLRARVPFSDIAHAVIDGELPAVLWHGVQDRVHVTSVDAWVERRKQQARRDYVM